MQKNVVVMAMSTLALGRRKEGEIPKIPAYRFGYPGGPEEGEEYYSQVEPSSKMILEKEGSLDKIIILATKESKNDETCLLYTSPSPRDRQKSRMPSSA